jgi:hypothetical protein
MPLNKTPRHRPRPPRPPRPRPLWRPWLYVVPLAACLLAACATAAIGAATAPAASPSPSLTCQAGGPVPCYSPQEYQMTYDVAPLLRRGINGRGETVMVGPEPAASPSPHGPADIRKDLAYFDKIFAQPRPD